MSLGLGPSKPDPVPASAHSHHTTLRKSFIMEEMGDKDIVVKRAFKTFQNNFNQPDEDKTLVKRQVPSRGTVPRVPTYMALRKENGESTRVGGVNKRSGNAVQTTLGRKGDIRAEKGKEDDKLQHNFEATPLPAFYRGQTV